MCSKNSMIVISFTFAVIACCAAVPDDRIGFCEKISVHDWTFTKYLSLQRNSSHCVVVDVKRRDVRYFVIEVHSQRINVTLSYVSKANSTGNAVSGTSIGLVSNSIIKKDLEEIFWIFNPSRNNATILLSVICYEEKDPIPGGCNTEFPIEISPFMRLYYNRIITKLQFQFANVGYPPKMEPPVCSNVSSSLSYKLYVHYLPEDDFSETSMFNALKVMQSVSTIKANALEVVPYHVAPETQRILMAYPGQGTIFNIIVHNHANQGGYAAYVPISTYGCSFESEVDSCKQLTSSFAKVFSLMMGILGLGICFKGHYYLTLVGLRKNETPITLEISLYILIFVGKSIVLFQYD